MATHWNMSAEEILRELEYSEMALRRDLISLSKALKEQGEIIREAGRRGVPPEKLLDWIIGNNISCF